MPKPKTDSRDRLIETAARLFQRQGYQGTGLSQIVEESGAPRGSVYFLFPGGKEELAIEAIEQSTLMVRKQIELAAGNSHSVEEWIRSLAAHFIEDLESSNYLQGCPISTVTLESVPDSPALQKACRLAYDLWIEDITIVLIRFGIHKEDAGELAVFLLSAVEGALILCRAQGSAKPLEIGTKLSIELVKAKQHGIMEP
ncbi:TetR/AcrR family transcriptional regulator [Paenibacillus sedimenti]|uniref:TetR/AcrR family transcriptional regulator n=1 Tax=Paenibacillus sedimenti TaxID=2770274 RepID=A0A926KRW8_9BACL|nr:TetR/AcrR family transcriptional regulator [Paenibacillus sedimenti]MBD0382402.1 TetR/AcrR family transcriptional regulator [Paenibacillus sedimenti]